MLRRVDVSCSVMQCVTVCCSVLQCAALCCSVLQCVAVCCSVQHSVAVYCSELQRRTNAVVQFAQVLSAQLLAHGPRAPVFKKFIL